MGAAPAVPVHVIDESARAAAVLHPLRLRILGELREPDSAAGLARRLGVPRQLVNYHLRQLETDCLVVTVGERKKRNCTERLVRAVARSYLISPAAFGPLAAHPDHVGDRASSAYLVAVAAHLISDLAEQRSAAERAGKRLATMTLETEVRFATPAAQAAFADELTEAVAALVAKYHDDAAPDGRRYRFIVGGYPASSARAAEPRAAKSRAAEPTE
jgi:DNA-binding transcriptional ArsR family regulator